MSTNHIPPEGATPETLSRDEMMNGLGYIATSPSPDFGGFHPNTVRIAASAAEYVLQLERQRDEARHTLAMFREEHGNGIREAYKLLGIEDDGELRTKWVLLGIAALRAKLEKAKEDWFCLDRKRIAQVSDLEQEQADLRQQLSALQSPTAEQESEEMHRLEQELEQAKQSATLHEQQGLKWCGIATHAMEEADRLKKELAKARGGP